MSCYNSSIYYASSEDAGSHHGERDDPSRHDREGSISGSESGSTYAHYLHGFKDEQDSIEDPHLSLTSQTLNADGTPKRPMNAFMIFARKRRPEISAANQMMRTGDVSKILSKEWNSMDMSQKKFYLDQAKKLKDNFNLKYPDYVYRRRPNNSRKKRKTDAGHESPTEHSSSVDREDPPYDEVSSIDAEDPIVEPTPLGYPYGLDRGGSGSLSYPGHDDFVHAQPSAGYTDHFTGALSARYGDQTSRMAYPRPSSSAQTSLSEGYSGSQRSPSATNRTPQGHYSQYMNNGSPNLVEEPHTGHSIWEYARDSGRAPEARSAWPLLPALDTSLSQQRASSERVPMSGRKPEAYSPQLVQRPWSTMSTPSSSSGASATQFSSAAFPTLTSPFVPNQSPPQRNIDNLPSPSAHQSAAGDYMSSSSLHLHRGTSSTGKHTEGDDQRGFTHSNVLPLPINSVYHPAGEQSSQWQPQYRATSSSQQTSPSGFPLSNLSLQSASPGATSPFNAGSTPASHIGYWDKGRFDGR